MFEGLLRPAHLLLILIVVLIIFGPGKLPDVGRAFGKTIREFRRAANDRFEDMVGEREAEKYPEPVVQDSGETTK